MRRIIRWIAAVAVALAAVTSGDGLFSIRPRRAISRRSSPGTPLRLRARASRRHDRRLRPGALHAAGERVAAPESLHARNIRLADGRQTVNEEFPQVAARGRQDQRLPSRHFGVPHVHLRWADADHLDTRSPSPA